MEFFTIGVYNSTEDLFFNKLIDNNIDTFCDIRLRRGVRGAKYSFVNSTKLQEKLFRLGLKYEHCIELAPTNEIRDSQKNEDKINFQNKRDRQVLGETFIKEYKDKILDKFELKSFLEKLEDSGSKNIVFFCVEENSIACHRSILTNEIEQKFNFKIKHL